jgi:hypothetical protein
VQAALREPNISVLKDQDDRIVREESYDMAFRPLAMGVLQLESGCQPLILKYLSKPGSVVAEIRALRLIYHPNF